jgi:hypothetical protein
MNQHSGLFATLLLGVRSPGADATGKPVGGDFAALEAAGTFMTFATRGSASLPGTSEVFLGDPFF